MREREQVCVYTATKKQAELQFRRLNQGCRRARPAVRAGPVFSLKFLKTQPKPARGFLRVEKTRKKPVIFQYFLKKPVKTGPARPFFHKK